MGFVEIGIWNIPILIFENQLVVCLHLKDYNKSEAAPSGNSLACCV